MSVLTTSRLNLMSRETRNMKRYGIGDTCYIFEDGEVKRGRVSAKKENSYFIQFVGSCGALQVDPEEVYATPEEAQAAQEREEKARPNVRYL